MEFHVFVDGQFNLILQYLPVLENIFIRKQSSLSLSLKVRIAHVLGIGHCFLQSDMEKVKKYDTMVLNWSRENQWDNMTASIALIRAYRYGFVGDWRNCREEIETFFPLQINPRVSTLGMLLLKMLPVNLLEMTGDFVNYRKQKQTLEQASEQNVVIQSVIGPFLHIWDIDAALADNDIDTAESLVSRALQSSYAAAKAHMRSQLLHYHAFILALRGRKKEAIVAIEESLRLRLQVGGNAFIILNHQIIGASFAQLGMIEEAEKHFALGLANSEKMGEEFQRAAILAHRACMRLQVGEDRESLEDVEQCLGYLKKNNYKHFFSCMPQILEPVLKAALRHGFEPAYAKSLLFEQLHKGMAKNGDFIPLLNIRLLGDLTISIKGGQRFPIQELTENERYILCVLITSPGMQVNQSSISLVLWPDKNPARQRSSLDVLISQIRKKLSSLIPPVKPKEYLAVEQGIVKLKNCQVDVLQFLLYSKQGQEYFRQGKKWQAGNSFHSAFELLGDAGLTGLNLIQIDLFQEDLNRNL